MYIKEETLDDLLRAVFTQLLKIKDPISATRGSFKEIVGVLLHLTNPRARLSRTEMKGKVFSALGEWLWYLSRANDLGFINYYIPGQYAENSDDGISVRSGYGERLYNLRGINQLGSVVELLRKRPSTRRAVIQLFDASDLQRDYASIPCTCTLQFLLRNEKLEMFVNMRSNDAYFGLPHDIFAFTMLQELVATSVGAGLGEYKHSVGSLHLYDYQFDGASTYLDEAWQSQIAMPEMPTVDPWTAIARVRAIEEDLRTGRPTDIENSGLDDYWADLCRLLAAYRFFRDRNLAGLADLRPKMSNDVYKIFIDAKADALR